MEAKLVAIAIRIGQLRQEGMQEGTFALNSQGIGFSQNSESGPDQNAGEVTVSIGHGRMEDGSIGIIISANKLGLRTYPSFLVQHHLGGRLASPQSPHSTVEAILSRLDLVLETGREYLDLLRGPALSLSNKPMKPAVSLKTYWDQSPIRRSSGSSGHLPTGI